MKAKQIKVQLGQGEKNVLFFADVIPEVNYQIEIPRVCMALGFYEIASYANMIKKFNDVPEIGKIFSKAFGDTTYHVVFSSENGLSNSGDYELISKSLLKKFKKEEGPIAVIIGKRCSGYQYFEGFPEEKVNFYELSL